MSDAQEILKMIEEVDPADTAKLDEIDARVWCFVRGYEFVRFDPSPPQGGKDIHSLDKGEPRWNGFRGGSHIEYTRSRDALKDVRPEGWSFQRMYSFADGTTQLCLHKVIEGCEKAYAASRLLPTEELAELHAIIQAIDHERGKE